MNNKTEAPGGFQKLDTRQAIKKMWGKLKERGQFAGFNTYEQWEEDKYKKEI